MPQPLGVFEISLMLGVKAGTVQMWILRGVIPEPRWSINGAPAWDRTAVLRWAGDTGRLPNEQLVCEYQERFGRDPWPARCGGRVPSGREEPRARRERVGSRARRRM